MECDRLYVPGLLAPPNTEIETPKRRSENLFQTPLEIQPRHSNSSGGTDMPRDKKVSG